MKSLTRIFASLAVLGAVASCQMYEIDTQMTPEKAAASIRMECSAVDSYTIPASNPDNINFNISSNTPWTLTLSSGADWLNVTPASSSGSSLIADVVVTAKTNTSAEDRTATLTLRGDNILHAKVITIKQNRAGKLFITPPVQDYVPAGGPLTFTIQTNVPWEIHSSAGWLHFNREAGNPDPEGRTLTIIATADPSEVLERTATVTVIAGDEEESFEISQKGTFSMTEIGDSFAATGESKSFTLLTDLPWSARVDKTWLVLSVTEGLGTGNPKEISVLAMANTGSTRKATITVTAGAVEKSFEVTQQGQTFEIVPPASTELPRLGGSMEVTVNSSIAWEPTTDVKGWTVIKTDNSHFTVKAAFNDIFKAKTGKVGIIGAGGATAELELTQDVNFTFSGHTEMLEDGSVKVYEDVVSGIVTKDAYQYVIMDAEVEMHLGNMGSFTMCTEHYSDGFEYELQFNLQRTDAFRLRANGEKLATRGSVEFTFDKAKLDAMTHCQIQFVPNAEDPTMIDQSCYCNGEKQDKVMVATSVYALEPTLAGDYFVGSIKAADDGSYFIIKSCTVHPVE